MICEAIDAKNSEFVKPCSKCKTIKNASEFSPDKKNKSGLSSWCKECSKKRANERYWENPEKARAKKNEKYAADPIKHRQYVKNSADKDREGHNARRRKRRAENPELYRGPKRKAYANDPEKFRAERKSYRQANLEKEKAYQKEWTQKNIDWVLAYNSRRRAEKLNATPSWLNKEHEEQIAALYELSRNLRESTGLDHQVDHKHPLKGENFSGLHVPWNLEVVTRSENARKHTSPPIDELDLFWSPEIRAQVRKELKNNSPKL
jgi:hypothetical protein